MISMRLLGRHWMTCLAVVVVTPVLASPIEDNDSLIDHYELKEKISRSNTRVDFNFDESVESYDSSGAPKYHEVNHDVFDQVIAPITGGDQPQTNNNGLFYDDSDGKGGDAPFTYTHFLRNPGLTSDNRAQIVGFMADSLIEFALKLDFHDLKKGSLLSVWALPVLPGSGSGLTLASKVKAKDLEGHQIRFNLYDDFGNAATIASLNALGGIIASSPNGGIKIDIDIDSSSDLKLKSSELELEFAIPEPAPSFLATILLLLAYWSGRRWRVRSNIRA